MSLFPAHAGVILKDNEAVYLLNAFPRIRGGDPNLIMVDRKKLNFSPHTGVIPGKTL